MNRIAQEGTGSLLDPEFLLRDWYPRYGMSAIDPPSDHIFLAEAVRRFGRALHLAYDADFPMLATLPRMPVVPGSEMAFVDGQPIQTMHDRFAPLLWAIDGVETQIGHSITANIPSVWNLASSSIFGEPHPFVNFDAYVREQVGSARLDEADWDILAAEADAWREFGEAARQVMRAAAEGIAQLALAGKILTRSRPVEGGPVTERMVTDAWHIGDPLARIRTCIFDPDSRPDTSLPSTHHVFVEEDGFDEAVKAYLGDRQLPLVWKESAERPYPYEKLGNNLVADIKRILKQPGSRNWRKPLIMAALKKIDDRYKDLPASLFERARTTAADELSGELPAGFTINRSGGRPSNAEKEMVARIKRLGLTREALDAVIAGQRTSADVETSMETST